MAQQPSRTKQQATPGAGFGRRFTLFTLFGFRVQMDLSWLFLALLITWSLASVVFPPQYPGLARATYWWMGVAGTIGLLFSLVFHELSHSLVARRFGIPIRGITLFIFGGVAEMTDEPPSAKSELWMALAGPAASLLLAGLLAALAAVGESAWPPAVAGVVGYLAFINLLLAVFNLVPAFPLDGGRVLRAALWWWKGDSRWATRWASEAGNGFGLLLMALGVYQVITGNFIGGMWWFLIGMFLRGAAKSSYAQFVMREMLVGMPVGRLMTRDPIAVPADITVRSLVDDYIYTHHHEQFPVLDGERLLGFVGTRQVKELPRSAWDEQRVRDVTVPCSAQNTVDPRTDAAEALSLMNRTQNSRLMVSERGRLVGVLTLKDLLALLSLRMDLEGRS
jgi:Zn-dependent protease/predicted transcriptional regulator